MKLGAFSISLAVKDIKASREFYEKLGFTVFGGNQDDNWLMLQNGIATIGLFQGMFEDNLITFNPGWDQNAKELTEFTDVRDIQSSLKQSGLELQTEVDTEKASGPGHLVVLDPDGNTILIDQHR
ncbi:MAG: VOC family protein [Anaerolineales bacterium]|nr:MAG: VOC family protein [Anaerolineales bacterium]